MQIDPKSWHYRFMRKVDRSTTWRIENDCGVTLCEYFWGLVLYLAICSALGALALVGLFYMIALPLWLGGLFEVSENNAGPIVVFGGALWLFSIGYFIYLAVKKYVDYCQKNDTENLLDRLAERASKNMHTPQIFKDYWKAHKEKYCPVLEIRKEEEDG